MAEACDECTETCLIMHKKNKCPDRVTTTFFKVMFGEDYSKILFLPPRFARSKQHMVGQTTMLEDSNGEKWEVKFTKVDGVLAFQEGWNEFALAHKLKVGDFLVFHYIMKSYFVVLMYGQSGCPENRHFGFPRQQRKETKKMNNLITNGRSPSHINTNGHNFALESSSQSERSVHEANENAKMSPNVNTNTNTHLFARPGTSGSDKETGQGSEPLVNNTNPDNIVSEIPTDKVSSLGDNDNEHVHEQCTKTDLQPEVVESDSDRRNSMVTKGGGLDEPENNVLRKSLETRLETEKRKASIVMQSEATHNNPVEKKSRNTNVPIKPAKMVKREPDNSGSRLNDKAKMEAIRREPTTNYGSVGLIKQEAKPEPADYDEAPSDGSSNTSFFAVMSSYQYLVLPNLVKLKSNVILLRNGHDLWAVLYQSKYGLIALTQGWGAFAKERGIKPGDKCEFSLESEPPTRDCKFTCCVFSVHIAAK